VQGDDPEQGDNPVQGDDRVPTTPPRKHMTIRLRLAVPFLLVLSMALQVMGCRGADSTDPNTSNSTETASTADETADSTDAAETTGTDTTSESDDSACAYPLVKLVTVPDSSCAGDKAHWWPVGMAASDCHGWAAVDTQGKEHLNSAKNIRCNEDGSFSFDQYAGNLTCAGTGKTKSYTLNACEQDTPPTLYTMAVDLTCCSDPTSTACKVGLPTVDREGATVYLNNVKCTP